MKNLFFALTLILISLTSLAQAPPENVTVSRERDYHYFVMFSPYPPSEVTFTITTADGEIIVQDWIALGVDFAGKTYSHYPYRTKGKRVTYYVTATHNGIESEPVEAVWEK